MPYDFNSPNPLPGEFGLKSFPRDTFRINMAGSFDDQLIVQVRRGVSWLDFSRGTLEEVKALKTKAPTN